MFCNPSSHAQESHTGMQFSIRAQCPLRSFKKKKKKKKRKTVTRHETTILKPWPHTREKESSDHARTCFLFRYVLSYPQAPFMDLKIASLVISPTIPVPMHLNVPSRVDIQSRHRTRHWNTSRTNQMPPPPPGVSVLVDSF